MSSYLFNNDEYENIPLMNDHNSTRQHHPVRENSNRSSSSGIMTIAKNNITKIALGCVVIIACILLFSSSPSDPQGITTPKNVESLTLTPEEISAPRLPTVPVVLESGKNYTDSDISEEYLQQFLEVYPNDHKVHYDSDAEEVTEDTSELEEEEEEKRQNGLQTTENDQNGTQKTENDQNGTQKTENDSKTIENGPDDDEIEPIVTHHASILDWSLDSKKKAQEELEQAKADEEDDDEEDSTKKNKKVQNKAQNRTGDRGRKRRNGKGNGKGSKKSDNKKGGKNRDVFDLSVLKKAMRQSSENPFTIDYSSIISKMTKQSNGIMSGDIDSGNDYSLRDFNTRRHKGHMDSSDLELFHALRFFHISDTHIDAFFNPYQSSQQGVCASCKLNSKVYGEAAYCPLTSPFKPNILNTKSGYAFGRYRCNPPPQLLASMLANIRSHQRTPAFFLITGDIGAHGMPTDTSEVTPESTLLDFCPTKFNGMRETLTMFRELFPDTPILFTPGNNDHLPKNKVWTPYFEAFAALLVEFEMLHPSQAATFSRIGSHYVDLEVDNEKYFEFITAQAKNMTSVNPEMAKKMTQGLDNIPKTTLLRAVLPDMTLLAPDGEVSFVDESEYMHLEGLEREDVQFPKRAELIRWLNQTLFDADKQGRYVLLGGHQPLTTKKGSNELLLTSTTHGLLFKAILAQYAHCVTSAYFGHRNLASISSILSPAGDQIIPSLTIPGVSPRGLNQPAFMELALSRSTGTVLDFEQFVFDLMEENERAQILGSNLREFIPTELLVAGTSADSGSNIVHQVIAARVTDNYDPDSYQKHKEEEAKEEDKRKKETEILEGKNKKLSTSQIASQQRETELSHENLANHGIDCGNDTELCDFMKKWGYLGRWVNNPEDISTFRRMTGAREFTAATVFDMNSRIPTSGKLYTALQVFKRAGLIGDSSPEAVWCQSLYDDEAMMMKCLFPEQDETEGCFAKSWINTFTISPDSLLCFSGRINNNNQQKQPNELPYGVYPTSELIVRSNVKFTQSGWSLKPFMGIISSRSKSDNQAVVVQYFNFLTKNIELVKQVPTNDDNDGNGGVIERINKEMMWPPICYQEIPFTPATITSSIQQASSLQQLIGTTNSQSSNDNQVNNGDNNDNEDEENDQDKKNQEKEEEYNHILNKTLQLIQLPPQLHPILIIPICIVVLPILSLISGNGFGIPSNLTMFIIMGMLFLQLAHVQRELLTVKRENKMTKMMLKNIIEKQSTQLQLLQSLSASTYQKPSANKK